MPIMESTTELKFFKCLVYFYVVLLSVSTWGIIKKSGKNIKSYLDIILKKFIECFLVLAREGELKIILKKKWS